MFCTKCGKENQDGMRFCQYCGTPLTASAQPTPPPAGYQQPAYRQPEDYVPRQDTFPPVIQVLRQMAVSPLFLVAAITYSCTILFTLLGAFVGSSSNALLQYMLMLEGMGGMVDYSALNSMTSIMRGASVGGVLIGQVPAILVAVGIWMMFAAARDNSGQPMKTGGLTLIRVMQVISLVFEILLLVILELALLISMLALSDYTDYAVPIVVTSMVLVALALGLGIVYSVKLIQTLSTMIRTIRNQRPYARISTYVAVLSILSGAASLVMVLFSGNFFSGVGALCSAAASITFGIFLFQYRSRMQTLKQTQPAPDQFQAPAYSEPAPVYHEPEPQPYQAPYGGPAGLTGSAPVPGPETWPAPVGETAVLQQPQETTVLNAQATLPTVRLIRVRNNAVVMIDRPQFRIGRDPGVADYIITDNTAVGRQHADIVQHDSRCFVMDLNSTNHTYVNGQQVMPGTEFPLNNGDQLMLGDECFQVEIR